MPGRRLVVEITTQDNIGVRVVVLNPVEPKRDEEGEDKEHNDSSSSPTMQEEEEKEDMDTKQQHAKKLVWTTELVNELLDKIEENVDDFRSKSFRRKFVWKKIWKELCEVCPHATLDQVQHKWRNMLLAVRRYDRSRTSKSRSRVWKPVYYERLNYILGSNHKKILRSIRKSPPVVKQKDVKSDVQDTMSHDSFKSPCVTVSADPLKSPSVMASNDPHISPCITVSDDSHTLSCPTVFQGNFSPSAKGNSMDNRHTNVSVGPLTSIITCPTAIVSEHKNFVLLKRPVSNSSSSLADSDFEETLESITPPDSVACARGNEDRLKKDQTKVQGMGERATVNVLARMKNQQSSSKSEALQILYSINEKLDRMIMSKERHQLQFEELLELSKEKNRKLAEKNEMLRELVESISSKCEKR